MLAGSLTEFSLPDVFSLLAATRKTGVLHLRGPEVNGRVWVIGGALVYATADITRSPLAARLLHGGEITPAAVEPLVRAHAAEDGMAISRALAAAGIAVDRIAQLLYDQTIDAVFDLSRWADGQFSFDPDPAPGEAGGAPAVPAPEVLEAVGARIAEWEPIVAQLPSPASVLSPVSRPPLHAGGVVQMTAAQWEVFTLVDGIRSASDVIALTGQGQFVVARLLAGLVGDGLIAVRAESDAETLAKQRAHHLAQVEQRVLGATAPVVVPPVNDQSVRSATTVGDQPVHLDLTDDDGGVVGRHGPFDVDPPRHPLSDEGAPSAPPSAPSRSEDAAAARRTRELAALGLGSPDVQPDGDAAPEPTMTAQGRPSGTELLARLIDGVKGA